MLTKQLQALIEVGLANGQSYDEIGGMLAIQGFSDSEITGLFDEYDATMKGEKPVEEQYLGVTTPAQQSDTTPAPQTPPTVPITPTPPVQTKTEVAPQPDTMLDLDASDDAISFVEEEAEEQAEYNVKTPSYLDKEAYEKNAQSASMVAKTITQPAEKEVFDMDKDIHEGEVAYATPSIPVQNNIPQQRYQPTTHVAAQPQPTTEKMTHFTSTLSTSCVGSDFTGTSAVDAAIMQTKTSTPPQLGQYPPVAQPTAPNPAVASMASQSTYQPAPAVSVGLGAIPELAAASEFAKQQTREKSIAPVIIILVIVLGMIFGFMYWYYFMSDLRTSVDEPESATTGEPVPLDPLQVDPFTGQLVQ